MIKIAKAKINDVDQLLNIVNDYASTGVMLPRSHDEVLQNLRDYFVAHSQGKVVAVTSLHIYTDRLSEIKALAVSKEFQHQAIATKLVKRCIKEAKDLGLTSVFALTYVQPFFETLGFIVSDKNKLPEKIWKECNKCLKKDSCDEICMEYILN